MVFVIILLLFFLVGVVLQIRPPEVKDDYTDISEDEDEAKPEKSSVLSAARTLPAETTSQLSSSISTDLSASDDESNKSTHFTNKSGPNKRFVNYGYKNWCKIREEWLNHSADHKTERQRTPLNEYDDIVEKIKNSGTKLELDRPLNLEDLIDVYQEIWNGHISLEFSEHRILR